MLVQKSSACCNTSYSPRPLYDHHNVCFAHGRHISEPFWSYIEAVCLLQDTQRQFAQRAVTHILTVT